MERVIVIGSPGAGKSTLARRLASATGLPLIHLDREYFQPGWVEPDPDKWREHCRTIAESARWIMDGNYGASLDLRIARADTVIDLDYPTSLCLWRAVTRVVREHGRVREDMAPGCPERFDWRFLQYIWRFRQDVRPRNADRLAAFSGTLLRFRSPRQTGDWLNSVEAKVA